MPRRREVPKREILPDPKFGNVDLSKFMNVVMESGKKAVAERIIYGALEQVEKKAQRDPLEIFLTALNNVKPMVEVKSRRVGGANYQVPVEVRPVRRMALAMRWLREAARKRGETGLWFANLTQEPRQVRLLGLPNPVTVRRLDETNVLAAMGVAPSSSTAPSVGRSRPEASRSSVDLPQPEPPRIARISPSATLRLMPSSA